MGSPADEGYDGEHSQHEVEITLPFYMGIFQVTQEEYQRVMGNNPSYFSASGGGKKKVEKLDTRRFPVENVSHDEVTEFCRKLSELPEEKKAGRSYRLPTEAEWEYACRGGAASYTPFHSGKALSSSQANFDFSLGRTCPVGSYLANAFGLFDMHGNVWEWCLDWFDANYYKSSPRQDPQGPTTGDARVLRGGSWGDQAGDCRAARRDGDGPDDRHLVVGCRVCFCLD